MNEIKLPPLPDPAGMMDMGRFGIVFSYQQMVDFACNAVNVDRKACFEPGDALKRYNNYMKSDEKPDPIARLRFLCSMRMSGQSNRWLPGNQDFTSDNHINDVVALQVIR